MSDRKQHPVLYPLVTGLTIGVGLGMTRGFVENYGGPIGYSTGVLASAAFAFVVATALRFVFDRFSKPAK